MRQDFFTDDARDFVDDAHDFTYLFHTTYFSS